MAILKRAIPAAVAIAVGLSVLVAVFATDPSLGAIGTYLINTAVIVAAFALLLGTINVIQVHARKIHTNQPGSIFSVVLIASMLLVLVIGLPSLPGRPSGPSQPVVQWIFNNVQLPIQASLSALLVFFLVTATYRLLLVRSIESAVMLIVVLLVLLGQSAFGLIPALPKLKDWILDVPTMAGVRGILLGVALGALLTGIRLLLGLERPYSD